jgi:hypothetical protein
MRSNDAETPQTERNTSTSVSVLTPRKPSNDGNLGIAAAATCAGTTIAGGSSGGKNNGGSSGKKSGDASDSSGKGLFHGKIGRLRLKAYVLLFASVILLVILIVVQLVTFKSFLYKTGPWNYDGSGFLSQHMAEDIDLLQQGMAGVAGVTSLQRYIDPQIKDVTGYTEFFPMLVATSQSRFMEYLTIMNADKTIAVNINNNRTGEVWDPAGIVSYILNNYYPGIQVVIHAPLTQEEYQKESPEDFYVGQYARNGQQNMKLTGEQGLIRWSGTPILSTNSSVTSPIGVLIAGYIMSGKTDVLEDAFQVSGDGLAAIKFVNKSSNVLTSAVEMLKSSDQSLYWSIGLDEDLQKSFIHASADVTVKATDGKSYRVRSAKLTNVSSEIEVILIRGYPTQYIDETYSSSVVSTLALFAGALIFDILSTVVGVGLFVEPLQRLTIYIKLKHYELMDDVISKLSLVKLFIGRLVIFGLISLAFLISMLTINANTLKSAYSAQLAVRNEIRANRVSFAQKQVQMVSISSIPYGFLITRFCFQTFGIITRAETIQFKDFALNSSNGQYSSIQKTLNSSAIRRKLESNTVVDANCTIIANAYSDRRGEYFSPEGFCEDIILNPRRVCILSTMSATQLAANYAPQYL